MTYSGIIEDFFGPGYFLSCHIIRLCWPSLQTFMALKTGSMTLSDNCAHQVELHLHKRLRSENQV